MSLSQALATAMAGLRVNQLGLSLVSSNVANAQTPGYVRKTLNQIQTVSGSIGASVDVIGVNRELDSYLHQQIRTEQSGASFADLQSSILASLQSIYGTPGGRGTLESALHGFTTAAQALSRQLNSMSQGIQALRGQAEAGLSTSVDAANRALAQIDSLNTQL